MFVEWLVVCVVAALWCAVVIYGAAYLTRSYKFVESPKNLSVKQIERNDADMADTMTYEITVAAPAAADVVSRELTVVVDGLYRDPVTFSSQEVNLGRLSVPQDSEVIVSVVDVDDAGNRSEPATVTFKAIDVVPPPAPGGVTITVVGETHAEPAVDVPVVEEPTTDDTAENA